MNNIYRLAHSLQEAEIIRDYYKKQGYQIAAIEAEWGDKELQADIMLSHHGNRQDAPPPCTRWDKHNSCKINTVFILSHIDIDCLYAIWILEGRFPREQPYTAISEIIGQIDTKGYYVYNLQKKNNDEYLRYEKFTAYFAKYMKKQYKDISNENIHLFINDLWNHFVLSLRMFEENKLEIDLEENYLNNIQAYNALDKKLSIKNKLHVFLSNNNYIGCYHIKTEDWESFSVVNILYNSVLKKISIGVLSKELAIKLFGPEGVVGILKKYFGEESGGRITIGGSPRHKKINFNNFLKFIIEVKQRIKENEQYINEFKKQISD